MIGVSRLECVRPASQKHYSHGIGQQVNFDLCDDSGAGAALLVHNPGGPQAGLGWATVADCSSWSGADHFS